MIARKKEEKQTIMMAMIDGKGRLKSKKRMQHKQGRRRKNLRRREKENESQM